MYIAQQIQDWAVSPQQHRQQYKTEQSDGTWPAIICYTLRNTNTSILFHSYSTTGFSVATYLVDGKKSFKINYQNNINLTHSYLAGLFSDCH